MNTRMDGERLAWQGACAILAAVPISLCALFVDPRTVNDIAIWTKPVKFELSLILHLATLALIVGLMPPRNRGARWLTITVWFITAACLLEVFIINMQSARGVGSHFNTSTEFDSLLYSLMGLGALTLTLPFIAIGLRFLTLPITTVLTPGLRLGIILGLTGGAVLTFLLAGYLSIQSTGHWVNAPHTDLGGLPLVGWSREGGDLRVPHFFATHLMQFVPATGWLADRYSAVGSRWPKRLVWAVAIGGFATTAVTFEQARRGLAFWP